MAGAAAAVMQVIVQAVALDQVEVVQAMFMPITALHLVQLIQAAAVVVVLVLQVQDLADLVLLLFGIKNLLLHLL
jgi:hypothetical protein